MDGGQVTFAAAASGTPAPTVQWQGSTDSGSNFSNIPGAISVSFTLVATASDSGRQFRAVFTNTAGTATTNPATLAVDPKPVAPMIVTQPSDQTTAVGSQVTFTAAASGVPAPSVQWQTRANDSASFADVPGATSASYAFTVTATDNNRQLRAVFTNPEGSATTNTAVVKLAGSGTAQLSVAPAGEINLRVPFGSSANQTVTLTSTGSGPVTIVGISVGTDPSSPLTVTIPILPRTLPSGQALTFTVNCSPRSSGPIAVVSTGRLVSDDPRSPTLFGPIVCQGLTTVTASGSVRASWTFSPVRDALVSITDANGTQRAASTDQNGYFSIAGLALGQAAARVSATGYKTLTETVPVFGQRLDFYLDQAVPDVEYRVSGGAARIISWRGYGGTYNSESGMSLPWSDSFPASSGQTLFIGAESALASGCITVEIYKNGSLYKQTQSCGAYVRAEASGTY
jgi:hypothetical protein